jgi:hypothetical protein
MNRKMMVVKKYVYIFVNVVLWTNKMHSYKLSGQHENRTSSYVSYVQLGVYSYKLSGQNEYRNSTSYVQL